MKKSLFASIALHLIPVFILLLLNGSGGLGGKEKEGSLGANGKDEHITEKPPVEVDVVAVSGTGKEKKKQSKNQKESKCETYFGGIGVVFNPLSRIVLQVPEGYPAYEIGIRPGDMILSDNEISGKIGTEVTVILQRGDDQYRAVMIREKICTEKMTP